MFENGKCASDHCPYSHLSEDQVKRALGQGSYEKRDTSRGSDEKDKGSRGRGKGRGKEKKVKARQDPEANLRAPGVATQPRLKPLFIS